MKLICAILFLLISSAHAQDQRRYSLDSVLGNLAQKFKEQTLSKSDYSKIKKIKPNQYRISQELKLKALISIPALVKQGRVVKKLGNAGQPGYVITYLQPGSVYHVLGLKVGDFLSKINDNALTNEKQIMEVFSKNKTANSIKLELYRAKAKLVLFYNFV